jgi:hypothetical protein
MLSSNEKLVILFGTTISSVYLFATSLNSINYILLKKNCYMNSNENKDNINKILFINGVSMLFSGVAFSYFTYISTKKYMIN